MIWREHKGFTLMEMLIVVAIIAVLIAIAIPVFSSQLTAARQATDNANCRSAKALASAECMTDYMGDFSAKTPDEWVVYVTSENGNAIPKTGQVDGSALTCTYTAGEITFVYGNGSGGGSSTAEGSVTVKDSSGKSYTISPSGDWATIKQSTNGASVAQGTVLSDSTGTYVVGWNNWFGGDLTNKTLADEAASGAVVKITNSTPMLTSSDIADTGTGLHWTKSVSAGTLCTYNGKTYIAPDNANAYTFPPGGWIAVVE